MSWLKKDRDYLMDNIGKQTMKDIAAHLRRSELAVHLYIHRNRIPVNETMGRNLVKEMLTLKFVDPAYFMPTRSFYQAIQMNQKRWWDLYHGRERLTEEEYFRLIEHFQVSLKDAFEARQLKLFDEE